MPSEKNPRALSIRELWKKDFPPGHEVIGGGLLNRGSLLVIGGGPKSYKSVVASAMMCHLATATPLFGVTRCVRGGTYAPIFPICDDHTILYFEQEIGEEDLKFRTQEYAKTLSQESRVLISDRLHILSCNHRMRLDTDTGVQLIENVIAEICPDVVCFDPLIEFHSLDENNATSMMKVLQSLDQLRQDFDFTTILVHHSSKPNADNGRSGAELLRGSSVLHGKGDSFLMIKRDEKTEGKLRLTFDLRRGKKISDMTVQVNQENFHVEFAGWVEGAQSKKEKNNVLKMR